MYSIMNSHVYALTSVAIVSCLPLLAGLILLSKKTGDALIFTLVSLSVGALFGDAFLHLIPDAFESGIRQPALYILLGIVFLFILEKFFNWHHEHIHEHDVHCASGVRPVGPLSLIAGGMHNFLDGAIIAASWLVSMPAGIATTIAVILHEIPHEMGDLGILLHAGYSKRKAFLYNFYSGLIAIAGAATALIAGVAVQGAAEYIIPFAAGNFIYIAGSDLVPELHKTKHAGHSLLQLGAILVGVALMAGLLFVE
jgi:zinc and cadmium transporter